MIHRMHKTKLAHKKKMQKKRNSQNGKQNKFPKNGVYARKNFSIFSFLNFLKIILQANNFLN